jgi:exodeoxyribonuclease VII large subunit
LIFETNGPEVLQLTVSQFSERLRGWLEKHSQLKRIAVEGEISDWKPQPNGNVYFKLKDDRAMLQCFAYSSEAKKFPDADAGMAVVATGAVTTWERSSEYRLRVFDLQPFGTGAMAAKIEALRVRLAGEGLFDESRKRPIPRFPRRVVLISARAEGARDFQVTLSEKAPNVALAFLETRVQGEGAELEIADAIDAASRMATDVVVVLRGGGSFEDRYPFNTEVVVRAIVRSHHPVITAIGHTRDHHLADDVADAEYKTPTAAAEHIAANWLEFRRGVAEGSQRMARAIDTILTRHSQRLDAGSQALYTLIDRRLSARRQRLLEFGNRLERQNPRDRVSQRATRLARLDGALRAWPMRALPAWRHALDVRDERLATSRDKMVARLTGVLQNATARLVSADPEKPLERGYAIVSLRGRPLSDARDAAAGDDIEAKLFHGSLLARVERVTHDE